MPRKEKRVLTDEEMAQVEALASCLTVDQIADYIGVGKTNFYQIMERQPEVGERYKKGSAKVISEVANNLISKAKEGDTTSMIFYLKTRAGWRETNKIELTGEDGGPVVSQVTRKIIDPKQSD